MATQININPNPISVGMFIDDADRYEKPYNGKVKVTKIDRIQAETNLKGAIIVHMTSPSLEQRGLEIRDMFPRKKPATPINDWAQTQANRACGALKSAGEKYPEAIEGKSEISFLNNIYKLIKGLEGKEIVISQYYGKNGKPRVSYKFQGDAEPSEDDEDEIQF